MNRGIREHRAAYIAAYDAWASYTRNLERDLSKTGAGLRDRIEQSARKADAFSAEKEKYYESMLDEAKAQILEVQARSGPQPNLTALKATLDQRQMLLQEDIAQLDEKIAAMRSGSLRKQAEEERRALAEVRGAVISQYMDIDRAKKPTEALVESRARLLVSLNKVADAQGEQVKRAQRERVLWRQYYASLMDAAKRGDHHGEGESAKSIPATPSIANERRPVSPNASTEIGSPPTPAKAPPAIRSQPLPQQRKDSRGRSRPGAVASHLPAQTFEGDWLQKKPAVRVTVLAGMRIHFCVGCDPALSQSIDITFDAKPQGNEIAYSWQEGKKKNKVVITLLPEARLKVTWIHGRAGNGMATLTSTQRIPSSETGMEGRR